MKNMMSKKHCRFTIIGVLLTLIAGGVLADKPDWAGGGKHKPDKGQHTKKGQEVGRYHDGRWGSTTTIGFNVTGRRIVREYYGESKRKGACPPGLAKKNNGCLPPGQAKKWRRGYRLPRDIEYYELPPELIVRLPLPPANHRYVRVAGDILMIAVGTGMVVDAIEDILR